MRVVLSALGVVDQSREDDDSAFSTPPLSAGSIWRHNRTPAPSPTVGLIAIAVLCIQGPLQPRSAIAEPCSTNPNPNLRCDRLCL